MYGLSLRLKLTLGAVAALSAQLAGASGDGQAVRATLKESLVRAHYATPAGREISLAAVAATPLSLATADVNSDGYPDLAAGYGTPGGGLIAIHLGNPEAFSPQLPSSLAGIAKGVFPASFAGSQTVLEVPVRPDFLALGDFGARGVTDLIFAAQGGDVLYIAQGDGHGGFGAPRGVPVAGGITALLPGKLQPGRFGTDVAVGLTANSGPMLALYRAGSKGLDELPEMYRVPELVTGLAIGNLDEDGYPDVALVTGQGLMVLHGRPPGSPADPGRLEPVTLPFGVESAALGHFVPAVGGTQIAVLGIDGRLAVLRRLEAGALPGARTSGPRRRMAAAVTSGAPWAPSGSRGWTALLIGSPVSRSPISAKLVAGRISGFPLDDLLVVDGMEADLRLWNLGNTPGDSPTQLQPALALGVGGRIIAAVPMRLNVMGAPGLALLTERGGPPTALVQVPGVVYQVTALGDSQSGTCTAPSGSPLTSDCTTLRAAIIASNANPGQDAIVFTLNGTVTLSVPGLDDDAQAGDLDVTDALTIVGNGAANTIIRGGPSAGNGVDKVFSFNPLGLQPGFSVSLSGVTIQFGTNQDDGSSDGDNEGGAFDFDASTIDGAGSLSMANCQILQNQTINGDGGGMALFDGGTVTIAGSVISGNQAGLLNPGGAWWGYYGGGVFITGGGLYFYQNIAITNTTISNNTAFAASQNPPAQLGGGIYTDIPNVAVQSSTVSGNRASSDGGGLYGDGFLVSQSTISGNASGDRGGGMFGLSMVVNSTITNNSSASWGGAFWSDGAGASISASRIVGNTSAQASSIVDADPNYGSTVTATGNWWGSNGSPANLFNGGVVTYSPWLVMTFTASSGTVNTGQSATLTAAIDTGSDGSAGYQVADGTPVSFTGSLGTVNPSTTVTSLGVAESTYTATTPGSATVTAAIDSQTLSVSLTNLSPYDTAIGLQFASTQLTYPGATNVTVCISPATNATATGTVQILDGTNRLTTLTLQGNGCAYWYISPGLSAGTHAVSASYSGDANNPAGNSAPVTLTVAPVAVNMSPACWNSSFPYGGNYQCNVTVSSNAGPAQGVVSYAVDSGSALTSALSNGNTQFAISLPAAGPHTVVIRYAQQGNFAAASPQTENFTVTQAPVYVGLTPSSWYATAGTNITFQAAISSWSAGPPNSLGSVSFYDGNAPLGTVAVNASGQANYSTASLAVGSHTITATYSGTANYASGSTSVTITVAQ